MRDYGKVHTSFWTSSNIRAMSEDGRALALYLLTSPHGTIAGVFRLPDGYACEDLQWDSERVKKGFIELFDNGFANRCETTKWVWIAKHLEWNPPENPNQRKAAGKVASQVPDECIWKSMFMRDCAEFIGLSLLQIQTLSKPFLNQEQEQEQEQEQDIKALANDDVVSVPDPVLPASPDCPHEAIVALYHETLPALPRVSVWDERRRTYLRSRWRESQDRQSLDWWKRLFGYVGKSDFLMGRVETNGRKPFQANLEWILKPSNFVKIIEGNYES